MAEMTADFLHAILPSDREGNLIVAVGLNPYRDTNGKYRHRGWDEQPFLWPTQERSAIEAIQYYGPRGDVYVCPYLMKGRDRHKGDAACRQLIHTDVDGAVPMDKVTDIGGFVVWSGSPGHGHVYVPLSYVVMPHQHETLCRGLTAFLGGDPAKISENDVLRPPGTFNHKPTTLGQPMAFVSWDQP